MLTKFVFYLQHKLTFGLISSSYHTGNNNINSLNLHKITFENIVSNPFFGFAETRSFHSSISWKTSQLPVANLINQWKKPLTPRMLPRTMVTHPGIVMTTIRLIYTNRRYKIVDFSNLYLLILIYFEKKKDSVIVSICYALQASKTISHGAQNISVLSQFMI